MHVCKKYPQALGGDAVVVSNLQKQQQAMGHNVVIVTSNCDEISNGPHVYKFGFKDTAARLDAITFKRVVSLLALFFNMFIILRKERPDVIHTHSVDMAFFVSFAARLYNIPVVHTFHIVTFYDASQSIIRRKAELWLAKKARLHAATTPNGYDTKKLWEAGLQQTVLLPNGVDVDFWQGKTLSETNTAFTFLTVGRLESQKGYEYLIKAAALLTHTQKALFRVVIVGEGSQRTALHQLIRSLQIDDVVLLLGRKNPEEIRALFAQADAAVFPSLYETTPVTMLEAWAAMVPVIVTSVGILRDVPADFGAAYVIPPKNEQSLMEVMNELMSNSSARTIIARKGHDEARKYAWPVIAQTAEAIYRGAQTR